MKFINIKSNPRIFIVVCFIVSAKGVVNLAARKLQQKYGLNPHIFLYIEA